MTPDEVYAKVSPRLPKAAKAEVQVKDYLTLRLKSAEDLLPAAKALKDELGFDYLEMVSATDWLGPVKPEGYIRNPNPIVFQEAGATPQSIPTATPNFPYRPTIDLLWMFGSLTDRCRVILRLELPRDKAKVPSLVPLFKAADWQEREIFDLMGVRFEGHPNLIKILTPEFTAGHPLRKDYVHQKDRYDD